MWTGYDETVSALEDIAIALNENYDFDIDTTNIDNILVDMSEQLMGSDLKVGDIPEALEIQIRILDEMQYHEISQMYTAWTSTEQMRPMTVQLVELYDQIDNLDDVEIDNLFTEFKDDLWITNEPNEYLLKYDNPEGLKTKSIKNMIKYYFEQVGRLQEGYINFNGAEHAFLDGFEISNQLDRPLILDDNLKLVTRDNIDILLPNSKEPYQLLGSIKDFEGVSTGFPFQVSKDYFNRYQEIIGKTLSDKVTDASFLRQEYGINQKMSLGEFSYQWQITNMTGMDTSAYDAIPTNVVDDVTPTQALDELDAAISKADGVDNLNKAKKIINNNPGVFKKIFSVLEKADIGDQVITKAIIPKVLPKLGLAAATGPVGMAYAAYEIALLLADVGQAAYTAQTTDESFWDNFGEVTDKYSIAYKISKPVYDIILDSLNQDLTEEEDEEILFSFNR